MSERIRLTNQNIEEYKAFAKREGFKLQIPVSQEPFLNQAICFPTKADSYGYVKQIRKGTAPNSYWVRTTDSGDMELEVIVTSEESPASVASSPREAASGEQETREAYFQQLSAAQTATDYFPTSNGEPNPDLVDGKDDFELHNVYERFLVAYDNSNGKLLPLSPEKFDYRKEYDEAGHKFHLNVAAKDVVAVAEYLKRQGYRHKYLSGGEITDGKVFTIYIGSKDLANKWAAVLSRDLVAYLKRPVFQDEVEYAPNIIGRFDGGIARDFYKYGQGLRGINILREDFDSLMKSWRANSNQTAAELAQSLPGGYPGAFRRSFDRLSQDYGSFFYGTGA